MLISPALRYTTFANEHHAEAPAGPWTTAQRIALGPDAHARKQHAMAAFATQTGEGEALGCEPILPEHVLARFRRSFEVLIG